MVIDSVFVYHFVDPDLRVEIFFEKEGAAGNGSDGLEIKDKATSEDLYWKLKKILCGACLLFFFLVKKNLKALFIIEFF